MYAYAIYSLYSTNVSTVANSHSLKIFKQTLDFTARIPFTCRFIRYVSTKCNTLIASLF